MNLVFPIIDRILPRKNSSITGSRNSRQRFAARVAIRTSILVKGASLDTLYTADTPLKTTTHFPSALLSTRVRAWVRIRARKTGVAAPDAS